MISGAPKRKKLISELKRVCDELKKMPREFTSLDLSHSNLNPFTKEMRKRFGEFAKVAELVLEDCGLVSLVEFPNFPELRSLNLIANSITDKEVPHLAKFPRLAKLCLSDNLIQDIEIYREFGKFRSLQHLDLDGNPIADFNDTDKYRSDAFKHIATLKSLDGNDIDGNCYVSPSDLQDDEIDEQEEDDNESDSDVRPRKRMKRVQAYDSFEEDSYDEYQRKGYHKR